MRRHAAARGGPVNLAWVLISGFNSSRDEARELGRLFHGVPVRVSLIDVNDPAGVFARASDDERGRFLSALAEEGLGFVRRYSGGPDIDAACGMLASRTRGGETHLPPAGPPA
jgi:23S rRNA (adenine2503-C2)-methyltransferase